jgi:hypothetical protein
MITAQQARTEAIEKNLSYDDVMQLAFLQQHITIAIQAGNFETQYEYEMSEQVVAHLKQLGYAVELVGYDDDNDPVYRIKW